ncbi:MAG: hypothetical protein AAGM04_06095 [Pseudomonadota bacterium]
MAKTEKEASKASHSADAITIDTDRYLADMAERLTKLRALVPASVTARRAAEARAKNATNRSLRAGRSF